MSYHKIHMTHVLVSFIWAIALMGEMAIIGFYHIPLNIWTFLVTLAIVSANSYYMAKWTFKDGEIEEVATK